MKATGTIPIFQSWVSPKALIVKHPNLPQQMSATTVTSPQNLDIPLPPPGFTILTRVAAIPMICSSLETINGVLLSNTYTRSPYSTAKDLSTTACKYTEPLQVRLAPFIIQADGLANKAVDVVQSRYPYPFTAKPEEVALLASKTIDERVKMPAYNVAQGIDQVRSTCLASSAINSILHSVSHPSSITWKLLLPA